MDISVTIRIQLATINWNKKIKLNVIYCKIDATVKGY